MNNIQDSEKDIFIKKELKKDELVSNKYENVFNKFLKGDHEMSEEEQNIETKGGKTKVPKHRWGRCVAAVAACALIFAGANVYATTQGYDNIFFLIKDLRNKNQQVVTTKNEILSDRDITISFSNIEIADGLFMQINRFVVKEGDASLFVTINQENSKVHPEKFIVTSAGTKLAEKNSSNTDNYSTEIKLSNYKDEMKVLKLDVESANESVIASLKIDLENREIDLIASDSVKEVNKISEIDLKQKLSNYVIMLNNDIDSKVDKQYMLGSNLIWEKMLESGINKNDKDELNLALKESMGTTIPANFDSEIFKYNSETNAYETILEGDWEVNGLCLNIDDLKYENGKYSVTFTYCYPTDADYTQGTVEKIDRFQTTLEFTLNENAKYTKYKILNFDTVDIAQVQKQQIDMPEIPAEELIPIEHTHNYRIIAAPELPNYYTTIDGTHTYKCSICGEEKQEPHHFGKWWTINNGTAWTLWCEDCGQYIFTRDYDFVQSHMEYGMNPVEEETHDYKIVKAEDLGEYHTTIDGTHTYKCTTCGEEKQEPHHFGKWWTINNGTAWTLWCEDCGQYIFTRDYDFVQSHMEYGMNPIEEETKPTVDTSKIDNYASSMDWTDYFAPGLKLKYPSVFTIQEVGGINRGNNQGQVSTIISGEAVGINKETNEIINSNMSIEIFEPYISNTTFEEYVTDVTGQTIDLNMTPGYTTKNGDYWMQVNASADSNVEDYFHKVELDHGSSAIYRVRITADPRANYKVTNIINWLMGSLNTTSY